MDGSQSLRNLDTSNDPHRLSGSGCISPSMAARIPGETHSSHCLQMRFSVQYFASAVPGFPVANLPCIIA
jgi:hypothetical protein